ncbi:conserved hypothetical protein [Paenibacillus curdlanolyticus YK9]|uniref:SnoaL-like domain-containing protein n=1 Tax=Paenibacillus curdlanolyticus YK9 TaxID=717606 RepID=E0IGM0_9BACL|nr:nuclear transport factor 2 family protein [Paenibacillus curdlanolyticus]EFM08382.1 conserved hypothetical protein [Paenibacillus curdlanolyticus YK9]
MSAENRVIIETYLEAYNAFDIPGIVALLHPKVAFRNFSDGTLTMETNGIEAFQQLAEQSAALFSSRRQTMTSYSASGNRIEIQIDYEATLSADLPNVLKAGDSLQLQGKSIFEITEGKLSLIEDYS